MQEKQLDFDLHSRLKDTCIEIDPGEFGWEVERYTDFWVKASYCMAYVNQIQCEDSADMLKKVIKDYTGCESVEFVSSGDKYNPYGYIDHQSIDVAEDAFESEETLKQFLFCPLSVLYTDNDNHD
jgi:hypothetical protein